jgi:hypothetical protein
MTTTIVDMFYGFQLPFVNYSLLIIYRNDSGVVTVFSTTVQGNELLVIWVIKLIFEHIWIPFLFQLVT